MRRSAIVSPKEPFTVTDDSRMSEDYLLTDDVLVEASSPNPLAAVESATGIWTALAVVPGRGLVHVVPDQSSQSGWDLLPMPSGAAAKEVVAVPDGTQASHAFYQDGTHTYHSVLGPDGAWSAPDVLPASTDLAVTSVPLTNEPVATGITPDGNLLMIRRDWTTHQWAGTEIDVGKALAGAQVVLAMIDHDNWTLAAVTGGHLQYFSGRDTVLGAGPYEVPLPQPAARIHATYQRSGSTMVMVSDDQNTLYTSFGFSDQVTAIPGSAVVQGAAIVDRSALIHFFGVDPDGRLWVLHQSSWDSSGAPVWVRLLPLDRDVAAVASPQSALTGKVLFAVGVDQTLHVLTQDPATQLWRRSLVQQPATKPYSLTRYRTQLLVKDAAGNPAPGVPVTIGASEETAILAGGTTYFVGPNGKTATIPTDATGTLTFSRAATSLVSPAYQITLPGTQAPQSVRPDQNYHAFLAGTDAINTSSALIPPMSQATLQNATVNGTPLAPGITGTKADTASKAIINAMNSVPGKSAALRAAGYVGWSLSVQDPDRPEFRHYTTDDELKAHLLAVTPSPNGVGAAEDVGNFFGDILHAIETFAAEVVDWVVDVANSLLNLVVKVADEVIQLTAMAIRTIEDAIPFIHAIFNWIGALVEKILDWVKDLLGWNDIWNTKLVFEHLVSQAIPALQWAIEKRAIVETGSFFSGLKASVDAEFATAISHFQGSSLTQISAPPNALRTSRGVRSSSSGLPTGSPAQNNWLMSKVLDNVGGSGALAPLSTTVPPDLGSVLWQQLSAPQSQQDLTAALSDLTDFFQTLLTDPKDVGTRGVSDVIKAAQALVDFVLDTLDGLVTDVLDILDGALGTADDILTQPLGDIPVVSWLYTNVICPSEQKEDPSVLRLACLVLAVPITLIYKVANQLQPPFDDATTQSILSWRFTPPGAEQATPDDAALAAVAAVASLTSVRAILSGPQACADMAADNMSVDAEGPLVAVAGWLDLVAALVLQVLYWPTKPFDFNWNWSELTEGQKLMRGSWIGSWAAPLVNLILLVQPEPADGKIAEDEEPGGKTWMTLFGAAIFGIGLAGSIKGLSDSPPTANGYDVAGAVLSPLPAMSTFLLFDEVLASTEGTSLVLKLLIDAIGDVGSGVVGQYG